MTRQSQNKAFNTLFIFLGIIIVLIIIIPLINMFFMTDIMLFKTTLKDSEVLSAILLTLKASLIATIFGILFGVPLAYILARYQFPFKGVIEAIIDIPVIIPHSAAGIALLGIVGKKYFVGKIFSFFGINFIGTIWGITLAMFFVSVPFLINNVREGFKLIDKRYETVARTLGAGKFRSFYDITLRLASRSVLSGLIMMWARGISEFGAVIILVYHPMVASVKIFDLFETFGLKYARPVAVLLIVICLTIFFILRYLINRNRYD